MIVGLTERHGMADEQAKVPPEGISYKFLGYKSDGSRLFQSPMKGFMSKFYDEECDLLEAVLTPARTKKPWVYSLACFEEPMAFSLFGLPTPKILRKKYIEYLFLKDNFKGLLFWSKAGKETLKSYGGISNKKILDKSKVVYPAINLAANEYVNYKEDKNLQILFNGNFFIKGGVNVVDSFEILQKQYPSLRLRLCCDEQIDFHTDDLNMRSIYLDKIKKNPAITMGRVERDEFLSTILPATDIYLLPTYGDAFGFAVLEAMAYGIPVVSTNYMAIPEMISQGESGFMVDISAYDCQKMFKGCYVKSLPEDFRVYINNHLVEYLVPIIEDAKFRKQLGQAGREICKNKFSFEARNKAMSEIYNSLDLIVRK